VIDLLAVKDTAAPILRELRSRGYAEMCTELVCRMCGEAYLLFIEGGQMENAHVANVFQTDEAVEHLVERISCGHDSGHRPERLTMPCALAV
jgi:hypothetical protein